MQVTWESHATHLFFASVFNSVKVTSLISGIFEVLLVTIQGRGQSIENFACLIVILEELQCLPYIYSLIIPAR
jgi:hypothetical protein